MNWKKIAIALTSMVVAMPANAATVLSFASIPQGFQSGTFFSNGFTLFFDSFFVDSAENEAEPLCCTSGGSLTVTKTGGGNFAFKSVEIQQEYGRGSANLNVAGSLAAANVTNDAFGTFDFAYSTRNAGAPLAPVDKLVFTGLRNNDVGVSFRNITVEALSSAVPEPATWLMMILGFGFVGGAMRYRKRSTSVSFANG